MDVCYLLLHGELPSPEEKSDFDTNINQHTMLHEQLVRFYSGFVRSAHPMAIMVGVVGALSAFYHDSTNIKDPMQRMVAAHRLIAKMPTIGAYAFKYSLGQPFLYPENQLSYSENLLRLMFAVPTEDYEINPILARALDRILILHADHTLNASTFAAREVASTRAHMYSAASAAVGALSGELHGGANYEVMRMLLDIKTTDNVESYIKEKFAKNERVMGMGHAVYKTVDPRSQVLKELCKRLSEKTDQPWYEITNKVEHVTAELMKKTKGVEIFPNVDLYSASVYYMLGIPMDLNTPIFAISRAAGWAAHIIEEKFAEAAPKAMLYRPKANYVGKYAGPQGSKYIPIEKRTKK